MRQARIAACAASRSSNCSSRSRSSASCPRSLTARSPWSSRAAAASSRRTASGAGSRCSSRASSRTSPTAVPRPVRDPGDVLSPALAGSATGVRINEGALMLTRTALAPEPGAVEAPRRLGYRLRGTVVELLTWSVLDQGPRTEPRVVAVLDGVKALELRYLDLRGQWHLLWPPRAGGDRAGRAAGGGRGAGSSSSPASGSRGCCPPRRGRSSDARAPAAGGRGRRRGAGGRARDEHRRVHPLAPVALAPAGREHHRARAGRHARARRGGVGGRDPRRGRPRDRPSRRDLGAAHAAVPRRARGARGRDRRRAGQVQRQQPRGRRRGEPARAGGVPAPARRGRAAGRRSPTPSWTGSTPTTR